MLMNFKCPDYSVNYLIKIRLEAFCILLVKSYEGAQPKVKNLFSLLIGKDIDTMGRSKK